MKSHQLTGALAAGLLLAGPAGAKDVNGEHAVLGPGSEPCSAWTAARREGDQNAEYDFRLWISGYLSAFNVVAQSTYDITGPNGLEGFIDRVDRLCRATPGEPLVSAVARATVMAYPDRYNLKPQ